MTHRVVIVGGGFAGLQAALGLGRAPVEVTVIDRRNFHLFQPLLYQVATGSLSPGEIASPLRSIVRRQRNTRVLLAEVCAFDLAERRVVLADGEASYDTLAVAAGAETHYFGREEWARLAPGLKTVEDATEVRQRILYAFEVAEREPDAARQRAWLTFVIAGAGPTGVELAGAIGEIANDTLRRDFRSIRPEQAQILLIDAAERALPVFPADLSARAERSLIRLGVRCLLGRRIVSVDGDGVVLEGASGRMRIDTHTVIWAAGVRASPLGRKLADAARTACDRSGRIPVLPDLTLPGHPEVLVMGDLAHFVAKDGHPLPGVAPVAMQQGRYVARVIRDRLAGRSTPTFRYVDKGTLATIGRASAVADFGRIRLSGWIAWMAWLLIHLMYLVGFQNRLLVLIRWAYSYLTFHRGARLITGDRAATAAPTHQDSRIS